MRNMTTWVEKDGKTRLFIGLLVNSRPDLRLIVSPVLKYHLKERRKEVKTYRGSRKECCPKRQNFTQANLVKYKQAPFLTVIMKAHDLSY